MQKTQTGILSSASDLANFLDRRPLTSLDRVHLETPLSKAEPEDGAMLLQRKGAQHERTYLIYSLVGPPGYEEFHALYTPLVV